MKTKWLLLLIITIVFSLFNYSGTIKFQTPSIQIHRTGKNFMPGEIVFYSVNINSNEYLKNLRIVPSIDGDNKDANYNYKFNVNTKQATINYFYAIPKELKKDTKIINLKFILTDKNKTKVVTKQIKIKNVR